jgi:hypothetical protein
VPHRTRIREVVLAVAERRTDHLDLQVQRERRVVGQRAERVERAEGGQRRQPLGGGGSSRTSTSR